MKATRRYGENLVIEVEGRDVKELWQQLSAADDAFGHMTCKAEVNGQVQETKSVHFAHREVDKNDYYELIVFEGPLTGYRKSFGQHMSGKTLFPKNNDPTEEDIAKAKEKGYNIVAGRRGWSKRVKAAT